MTADRALTRRGLLRGCALLPLVSLPLLPGCSKSAPLCADPALLSRGEEQMRKTREYVEASSIDKQHCANCEFFSAADGQGCGHCEILDGSVNEQGYCTSWARRG
jgi:hypothetical protein